MKTTNNPLSKLLHDSTASSEINTDIVGGVPCFFDKRKKVYFATMKSREAQDSNVQIVGQEYNNLERRLQAYL